MARASHGNFRARLSPFHQNEFNRNQAAGMEDSWRIGKRKLSQASFVLYLGNMKSVAVKLGCDAMMARALPPADTLVIGSLCR